MEVSRILIIKESDDSIEVIGDAPTIEDAKEKAKKYCDEHLHKIANEVAWENNTHPFREYEDLIADGFGFDGTWHKRRGVLSHTAYMWEEEITEEADPTEFVLIPYTFKK